MKHFPPTCALHNTKKLKMNNNYYYFSTHTIKESIYSRLEAGKTYKELSEETKDLLNLLVDKCPNEKFTDSPLDYCSKFIMKHKNELSELLKLKGSNLKYFLTHYLGFHFQWGASTRSFGANSNKKAERLSEKELIEEMVNPKKTIKKLLDSAGGDLSAVKPFLPALMISLDTNTRDKAIMKFKHTGKFCFDYDKLEDSKEAIYWMNKVWEGTKNVKPYMAFLSPRGKGFKVFCQVDTSNKDFIRDFGLEEREVVMKHHKVWYEGARKELESKFPELKDKIDISTNDPQRMTYIPFIADKSCNFKYNSSIHSNYSKIVHSERTLEQKKLLKNILKHSKSIEKIMKEQGITSKEDAYHLLIKNKSHNFDLEYETEKFIQVIDFIEKLSLKDDRVSNWVYEKFNDYHTLQKLSWVLYGIFGELAIDQIKRLIPEGSNKLDENHNDYRWAIRSKDDYDAEQLSTFTAGAFYKLVMELGVVKDFISEYYTMSSANISDFKLINSYYETYRQNIDLEENGDCEADLTEFLDNITGYLDKKKIRLPLIQELEDIPAEINLGTDEYLNNDQMQKLFQNTYADKRIFCLRSQCGSGKNSIAGHPDFKMKGRVILGEPFKGISNQIAKEGWDEQNRPNQIYVNSTIDDTVKSFKEKDSDPIKVNYYKTLRGADLPTSDELVIHCTFDQILNVSHEVMATFDYVFIDEAHTLSDGLEYRSDTISSLIYHIVEFVAKKRTCKTKIIFMSGTPNVETHVIKEIMKSYEVGTLFQRIIVDKKYKKKPTIHLTHLDSNNSLERADAVISQINTYIKQGRKVCQIFNNKAKMDEYVREIQSKLSSSIKVGLFYSGSEGECTQNILSGKFGDFDVLLTTTFFINGININKDGLSDKDIEKGKTSTQKYGVIIDLGNKYSRINSMNAIQAINRFRNRECHTTVFLPKIFKTDEKNTKRKFNFRNAGKTLLGINMYNYHLLSVNKNATPNQTEEKEEMENIHLLDEVRKNPLHLSLRDISASTNREENKKNVVNSVAKKSRIYEDWFCSLDGYHYMAKDAGFLSIIKNKYIGEPFKKMPKEQVNLENELIRNFLDDEKIVDFLDNQIDPTKRILVKASNKILDPLSTNIGNFSVKELMNDKYILEGDFHSSHKRAINVLIKMHLKLSYWYNSEKAIEILRFLINPKAELILSKEDSYLKNISKYVNSCYAVQSDKLLRGINYIKAIDYLSKNKLGISKEVEPTFISFTIDNVDLVKVLKDTWAKQQHEVIMYNLNTSLSPEKKELKKYYSKTELIKKIDLEELESQLDKLADYRPLRYTKSGNIKNSETIIVPRILKSLKLKLNIEIDEFGEPELSTEKDNLNDLKKFYHDSLRKLKSYFKPFLKSKNKFAKNTYKTLLKKLNNNDIEGSIKHLDYLIKNNKHSSIVGMSKILHKLKHDFKNWDRLILTAFKTSEYMTYRHLTDFKSIPFVNSTFFCDEDFKLESLDDKFTADFKKMKKEDIYKFLNKYSILYKSMRRTKINNNSKNTKLSPTHKSASKTLKTSYVVLNKNSEIIYADFELTKTCKFLCDYAFKNEGFVVKDASTPAKNHNKGIYNANTFKRDYYCNSSSSKTVANYSIQTCEVDIRDYQISLRKKITTQKSSATN
jgi:hypothetical protein